MRITNEHVEVLLAPIWVVVYNNNRSEKLMGQDFLMLIHAIDGSYLLAG